MWKIIEDEVPKCGISWTFNERRGRPSNNPPLTEVTAKIQPLCENSLQVLGTKLLNAMPQELMNLSGCNKDTFKSKLYKFLELIPDQPKLRP